MSKESEIHIEWLEQERVKSRLRVAFLRDEVTELKNSLAKCDAERIALRTRVEYLLSVIKERSGNVKED